MKTVLTFILSLGLAISLNAQIETPAASPSAEVEQTVGLTEVEVEYSRPNMRGRAIFGDLVPYGKLWRTGANKNTTISFSDDVIINGKTLKAGSYAIYSKPNKSNWEVYFYSDTNNWGTPEEWDESKVAAKVTTPVYNLPMDIESFTISIDDLAHDSAVIGMMWEKAYVGIKFEVPTDKKVTEQINATLAGPSAGDYYSAAVYYREAGKDIKQAKKWIDKAMANTKKPAFWQLRQQSLIYAEAGDKAGAVDLAKKSLKAAKEAGNDDYVRLNTKSLKEWGAM